MNGGFRRLGDLPPDLSRQVPGVGSAPGPYPGSAPGPYPGSAQSGPSGAAQGQQPAALTGGGQTSLHQGTGHPLYKAADYSGPSMWVGNGASQLVAIAKNRRYLGVQNMDTSQDIYMTWGVANNSGVGILIVPGFLWDNQFSPPRNDIYVWAPSGVIFNVTEGL